LGKPVLVIALDYRLAVKSAALKGMKANQLIKDRGKQAGRLSF
jgi:hypothetical protein